MELRLLIINKRFSVFAVSSRFIACYFDNVEDGGCFAEDDVHFFEGAVGGFGVEEVDAGEYEGVAVGLVMGVSEGCWRLLGRWKVGGGKGWGGREAYITANMM